MHGFSIRHDRLKQQTRSHIITRCQSVTFRLQQLHQPRIDEQLFLPLRFFRQHHDRYQLLILILKKLKMNLVLSIWI